jgi:hypothetical protein
MDKNWINKTAKNILFGTNFSYFGSMMRYKPKFKSLRGYLAPFIQFGEHLCINKMTEEFSVVCCNGEQIIVC